MSPMDYIKENVSVTSARKLLYGCVFKKFRIKTDEHEENLILAKVINSISKNRTTCFVFIYF